MQSVMNFLLKYYLYFLGALVIFILGLIGYLVDNYKTEKFRKPKIKKEIKKDIPKIKEASQTIENLDLDKLSHKTISSLQKDNQKVSSKVQEDSVPTEGNFAPETLNVEVDVPVEVNLNSNDQV